MKRLLFFISLAIAGAGCSYLQRTSLSVPHAMEGQSIPLSVSQESTNVAIKKADDATVEVDYRQSDLNAKVKADIQAAREDNQRNTDGNPKLLVEMSLGIAEARLGFVPPDPLAVADAAQRRALVEAGRADEAHAMAMVTVEKAQRLADELAVAKADRELALRERDAARAAEEAKTREFVTQMEANKVKEDQERTKLKAAYEKKLDEERQSTLRWISRSLVGAAILFALIGAFSVYSTVQSGDILKAITRGIVWAGFAAFFIVCGWVIGHPYFPYVLIGGGVFIVIAGGVMVYVNLRDAKEKRAAKERTAEADEAEEALKRIATVIDKVPETDPMFQQLRSTMDERHKALILELRAEEKRQKSALAAAQ